MSKPLDVLTEPRLEDGLRCRVEKSSQIRGLGDGDYPPWLYSAANELLPQEFRKKFGELASTSVAVAWTEYPANQIDTITRWLEQKGFSVTAHLSYDWGGGA